ncbi:HAD-IIIA family hydrolase [Halobacteriovorax sp. HLS]|uniref:D-glycero-alpha-D-manno-heptose-1,7-bisphosphate 7-phosphatase n=1 Tax=Halobacteriovorax sp. HLS TaxID=2234000 RepID=UPI000FDA4BD6|nr:HAD-IIIA family hydrolase [Halobacteriovorax sp. HLS]
MKEISLLIKCDLATDYITHIEKFFSVKLVKELTDNCLVINSEVFVDWEYLRSCLGNTSINFQFIEFYQQEVELDRYRDSGISYYFNSDAKSIHLPLVEYSEHQENLKKALFLDRDGIINIDTGYVYKFSEDIIYEDIAGLISLANSQNFEVIVVTNQAGVARGKYTIEDVNLFHTQLKAFLKKSNAIIDHIEICPFHFEKGLAPWNFNSLLRKPMPGMLLRACSLRGVSLLGSLMVGDKESDHLNLIGPRYLLLEDNYKISENFEKFDSRSQLFEKISNYLNKTLDLS